MRRAGGVITFSLRSGSSGNAYYVEAAGVRLLVDAGLSGRQASAALAERGGDMADIDALFLTHEHGDHASGAGIWCRRHRFPLHASVGTLRALAPSLAHVPQVRPFRAGDTVEVGAVSVHTLPTAHDAAEGVALVIAAEGRRLGLFTDLGHPFSGLSGWLEGVDAAWLESNYDPELLAAGPYPPELQARIRGPRGHLSNPEAAALVAACGRRPAWIGLAHLSEQNNRPGLALQTHRERLGRDFPLQIAPRHEPSPVLDW